MKEILDGFFIGNLNDCIKEEEEGWAILHACKIPCHQRRLGYRGNLPETHPNYLYIKDNRHLYLNMVDMRKPLSPVYTNPIMFEAMDFIDEKYPENNVLIHCNRGYSRGPSIALVYLARKGHISNVEYERAVTDFIGLYPKYFPGNGMKAYLRSNWKTLMEH